MKIGRTLLGLAEEIDRQARSKRDLIANTETLMFDTNGEDISLSIPTMPNYKFSVTDIAHRQVGDRLGIPTKYYDRMRKEAPYLLTSNVNHWFETAPEDRMLRTMDGNVRAFLSNRYRRLDNYDLMEAIMPTLAEIPDMTVESCEITDSRLYLKIVSPRTMADLAVGDPVQAGIVITNSEVGMGAFKVEPMIYRLVCKNGMIAADYSMQKYHVGKIVQADADTLYNIYSDETLAADDRAFWLKARDVVKGALSDTIFNTVVNTMREAKGHKILGDPQKAVVELTNRFSLNQDDSGGILRYLINDGDLSKLGMANAVTRYSQDEADYDRATDLERIGGKIIVLKKDEWKVIAEAA